MAVTINDVVEPFRNITRNPFGAALLTTGAVWGTSKLMYPALKRSIEHLTKQVQGRNVMYDAQGNPIAMPEPPKTKEQLRQERKDEARIPWLLGGIAGALVLAGSMRPIKGDALGGIFTRWDDPIRLAPPDPDHWIMKGKNMLESLNKKGSTKKASDTFSWDIPDQTTMDFGRIIPVKAATDIIMNDPYTEIYHKGNALAIINDASRGGQDNKMTAGSLFDSALNKVQRNLTVQGVTNAALRSVIGYGVSKAFTNTIGNLVGMPKGMRDGIVSAGMITNVIQGLY